MKVTDCHCHIYPEKIAQRAVAGVGAFYGREMHAPDGAATGLLKACANSPIRRFIVHSVATKPEQVRSINDFIASACHEHPEFVGFMTLHQDFPDIEGEIERACALGLQGIKLHPDTQRVNMDDPRLLRIYEAAEGRLPIIMHCGDYRYDFSHPRRMAKILRTFPDLVVNAAHFGGWSIFDLALEHLEDADCYLDMSSSIEFIGLRRTAELCRAYGCHRMMFGSDFPMWQPVAELERFLEAGFAEDELALMLWDNAQRFIANEKPAA